MKLADKMRTVALQFETFTVVDRIDPDYVMAQVEFDAAARMLLLRIQQHVLHEVAGQKSVAYPATWWDAFKLAHFPKWLQDRYPPIMRTEVFELGVLYPDFRPALADRERFVKQVKRVLYDTGPIGDAE